MLSPGRMAGKDRMPRRGPETWSFVYPRDDGEPYEPAEPVTEDRRDDKYGDLVRGLPRFLVRELFDEVVLHFRVARRLYPGLIEGKRRMKRAAPVPAADEAESRTHDIASERSNLLLARQCYQASGLIATGKKTREALFGIDTASRCTKNVMILGETGSGKELVAEAIHSLSVERGTLSGKFVPTNCATLSRELAASELFGHVKGAFTGATSVKKGLLGEANGGTLFLDELQAAPAEIQNKLLRAVQSGEVFKVGATTSEKVNVRFIAALPYARGPLETPPEDVVERALLYRIAVLSIHLPRLCEREPRERTFLFEALIHKHAFEDKRVKEVRVTWPKKVFQALFEDWSWPGNVRELENLVQALVQSALARRAREGRTEAETLEIDTYDIYFGASLVAEAFAGKPGPGRAGHGDRAAILTDLLPDDHDGRFGCKQRKFLDGARDRYWSYWCDRAERDGLTVKEVASFTGVDRKTVQKHLGRIRRSRPRTPPRRG
jgi:transcriptional regulator with AAA-type ATPase domain